MEIFEQKARVEVLHIPYRVSAPAMLGPMAGRVQLMCGNMLTAIVAAREGEMLALAVTSEERGEAAPELPTRSEFRAAQQSLFAELTRASKAKVPSGG